MNAADKYYSLKDRAHSCWMQAQDLISQAEDRFDRNNMTIEQQAEWYEILADATKLQEQAIELEKSATLAQLDMWYAETYARQTAEEKEYAGLLQDQSELRG